MSSDDYGTVNVKRGDRTREIEILRQHYRRHRESLQALIDDAPTEHLAGEYQRLVRDIDGSLGKLDELDGRGLAAPLIPPPQPQGAGAASTAYDEDDTQVDYIPPAGPAKPWLLPLIGILAVLALGTIAWLAWRGSKDDAPQVVETPVPVQETQAPAPPPSPLAIAPASHDFGTIRKGTRATRQYEIANNGDEPVTVEVARSTCRCLYYEHAPVVPPRAKESLTVTVDGARAKSGALTESIRISAKGNPAVATTFDLTATVQ
jgi:hypothetical protein